MIEKVYLIKTFGGDYEEKTLAQAISFVKSYINNAGWAMGKEVKIYPVFREITIKSRTGKCVRIVKDKEGIDWK